MPSVDSLSTRRDITVGRKKYAYYSLPAAEEAGLIHVTDEKPGITRRIAGKGFGYRGPDGKPLKDARTLDRIRKLAIPPAYTDVWICPSPRGHLQATGRDARGRKQYRYHVRFREVRDGNKYGRMLAFARALPQVRAAIAKDMARPGLPREKVLAAIVHLLENTLIRVGNDEYARTNKSFGLTTLRDRHVAVEGTELRFRFKGKSGKEWNLKLKDRRVARIVKAAQDLPGQHLFQYLDGDGARREVTSTDVNAYLRDIAGEGVTAKDFRTWAGTVLAAMALAGMQAEEGDKPLKANVRRAIESVAAQLGNTPAVCRKCYVHPDVLAGYMSRDLLLDIAEEVDDALAAPALRPDEQAVLRYLEARLELAAESAGPDGLRRALE